MVKRAEGRKKGEMKGKGMKQERRVGKKGREEEK